MPVGVRQSPRDEPAVVWSLRFGDLDLRRDLVWARPIAGDADIDAAGQLCGIPSRRSWREWGRDVPMAMGGASAL